MAITHSTAADGTFSGTGATAWDANHTFAIAAAGAPYSFDTDVTASAPASGALKFNSATPASITLIRINETDAYGYGIDYRLDNLSGGDIIQIYSVDNQKYMVFTCTGEFQSGAGVDPVPVIFLYGAGSVFSANEKIFLRIDETGASMLGARITLAAGSFTP